MVRITSGQSSRWGDYDRQIGARTAPCRQLALGLHTPVRVNAVLPALIPIWDSSRQPRTKERLMASATIATFGELRPPSVLAQPPPHPRKSCGTGRRLRPRLPSRRPREQHHRVRRQGVCDSEPRRARGRRARVGTRRRGSARGSRRQPSQTCAAPRRSAGLRCAAVTSVSLSPKRGRRG